jgi:L-lactate utilization protein LutC
MNSRQCILESIQTALQNRSHIPDDPPETEVLLRQKLAASSPVDMEQKIQRFKEELIAVSGECVEVISEEEIAENIVKIMQQASANAAAVSGGTLNDRVEHELEKRNIHVIRPERLSADVRKTTLAVVTVGIVQAAFGVADSGTLVVPFVANESILPHFLPETVIALLEQESLLSHHFELLKKLTPAQKKNMMMITGPSRTADIEKILILGAHGPRRLIVLLLSRA